MVKNDKHQTRALLDENSSINSTQTNNKNLGSYNQTPTLNQLGTDLTKQAIEGKLDPVIGRADEIQRVIQIWSRRTKNNPCLIGEPGVGKTAVAVSYTHLTEKSR